MPGRLRAGRATGRCGPGRCTDRSPPGDPRSRDWSGPRGRRPGRAGPPLGSTGGCPGILADFVTAEPGFARAADAVLGVCLRGVVVHDTHVAVGVVQWFREAWKGSRRLLLLPLDRVPAGDASGSLLGKVTIAGEGGPWVRALLRGFELGVVPDGSLGAGQSAARVLEDGSLVDREGVIHVGNPLGVGGLLERKERLLALDAEADRAKASLEEAAAVREEASAALAVREEALIEARVTLEHAEDACRTARSQQAVAADRLLSTEWLVHDLESRHTSARDALGRTREIAEERREERESLLATGEGHRARREVATTRCRRAEDEWEEVRGAYSRLAIERTRLEGEIAPDTGARVGSHAPKGHPGGACPRAGDGGREAP